MGDDAMSVFRWRAVRRFTNKRNLPRPHLTDLDQAEQLFCVADAFGVSWPRDRRRIELRLMWLGMEPCRAWQLSDVLHLLHGRPSNTVRRREVRRLVGGHGGTAPMHGATRRRSADGGR